LSVLCLSLLLFCETANSQSTQAALLPDAPGTLQVADISSSSVGTSSSAGNAGFDPSQTSAPQPGDHSGQQTKRILGIFPNFRAVSANVHLPPQTVREKFTTASQDSFDYSSVFLPAAVAGIDQATNATPEFHQGAAGYGRYFWHTFVDQTSENYLVEFIVPVATHEDTRYYTLGSGGFFKRAGYSLSRAVVTRNDKGHDTFNLSEVLGSGAAAGISNLYYPASERTLGNTTEKWGENVGIDAATFLFHEFWPDVNHWLFHSSNSN
jgi:hypothetical protein